MELKNYNVYFFFLLLAGVSIATFYIIKPFITAIVVAAVLSVIFHGVYSFFVRILGGRKRIGALITALIILLIIILPFFLIMGMVVGEIGSLYQNLSAVENWEIKISAEFLYLAEKLPLMEKIDFNQIINQIDVKGFLENFSQWILVIIQKTYQGIASSLLWTFTVFFVLYYMFIDGEKARKKIMALSPLKDKQEKALADKFSSISQATIKGTIVVGIVQGLIGGVAFALLGVKSPAIWGVVMAVFSIIPMVGAGIIWGPIGAIMIISGHVVSGVIILLVGALIISTIDNLIRPELVGHDVEMHPIMVFFATLGGISMFGFLGFIIGPVIVSLCLSLWEIYADEFKSQLKKYNT